MGRTLLPTRLAVTLIALLLAPPAAAGPVPVTPGQVVDAATAPCIVATIGVEGGPEREIRFPTGCDAEENLHVQWRYGRSAAAVTGSLLYRLEKAPPGWKFVEQLDRNPEHLFTQTAGATPLPLSLGTRILALLPSGGQRVQLLDAPSPESLTEDDVVIEASWEIVWDFGDCRASRGRVDVAAGGPRQHHEAPRNLVALACLNPTLNLPENPETPAPALPRDLLLATALVLELTSAGEPTANAIRAILGAHPRAPPTLAAPHVALPDAGARLDAPRITAEPAHANAAGTTGQTRTAADASHGSLLTDSTARAITPAGEAKAATGARADAGPLLRAREPIASPTPTGGDGTRDTPSLSPGPADPADPAQAAAPPLDPSPGTNAPPATAIRSSAPDAPPPPELQPPPATRRGDAATIAAIAAAATFLAVAGAALYQRIRSPAALDHPARRALHAACAGLARPATITELAKAAGIQRTTAAYHLRYLAKLGILRADDDPDGPQRYAIPAVRSLPTEAPLDERIHAIVRDSPGISAAKIAAALGLTRPRADRILKDLLLEGALDARITGRTRLYFTTSKRPDPTGPG